MTTQLLFYESAVPVSRDRHGGSSVQAGADYAFARSVNSVQLMAVEFPAAAAEYAIVFAGQEEATMPAVILGVRGNENLFLAPDGSWQARYIPAFVRRYPFVFSSSNDGKTFTLCVDESFPGFNREGRGQPLFGADGEPTAYVGNVLKFLQDYQAQFQRTQAFCRKLRELGLLEPMQAQISTEAGERLSLGGFWAVNRGRLKALPGDKLAELAKTDELELLYLHLQSMRNFDGLRTRMAGKQETETEARADAPAAVHD
ncbi:SapC family protein [Ramlibacter sp. G-1-2-2]|uniref:SapC family protein n=1 Tax=Ramlibacter agri TaxID=2728837 RepID=A0A848HA89_9BURK|nr:SapC family protein [Ramlibacter agri]NML47387.1 SapC family protein [Ramlibacter agri]